MEDKKISEERINSLKQKMRTRSWTDEELNVLTPKQWSFVNRMHKLNKYKLIAEVVQINDHCDLNPAIGDKYVFNFGAILNLEESTLPGVCMWALAGITPFSYMVMDRVLSDLDPNSLWRDQATCTDCSVRNGGLGNVVFRLYCEKIVK